MKYRIFNTSEKAWSAMLAAIKEAKRSIYLQLYILGADSAGDHFYTELENAARRGVRTIVMLDVVGSLNLFSDRAAKLRASGVEVVYCSFLFQRLHRKILVVDEVVAFVGGVNVGKKFAFWRDLQIRVTGDVVRTIIRSFSRVYHECGGANKNFHPLAARMDNRQKLSYVDHGLGKRRRVLRTYYEERLSRAKSNITLVTPYLVPPRWLIALLHQALIRGVKVDILLPEATDHMFARTVNRSYAKFLSELGAVCHFMKGMNHAKAMLIDDREGVIGSQNLDFLSMHVNLEAGVFFEDQNMVQDLKEIIDTWKKESTVFDPKSAQFHWYDVPIAFLLRLFGFIPLE
jgi:cardiolipin synthase A/B